MKTEHNEAALAHALARIGLGINIALHGWTRIPGFTEFQAFLQKQFEGSILSPAVIEAMGYVIVSLESVLGLFLLLGLFTRYVLFAGGVLMWILLFGVCLIQNWVAAGSQMVYLAFFAVLLATVRFNRYSLDALLCRRCGKQAV